MSAPDSSSGRLTLPRLVSRLSFSAAQARVAALVALVVLFSLTSPVFLSRGNLTNILVNASVVGIIAIGMTLLLVAQQIDISVGSSMAFAAAVFVVVAEAQPLSVAIFAGLLAAVVVAVVNVVAIIKLRVHSIIVTLAGFIALRGAAKLVLNGRSVPVEGWTSIGRKRLDLGVGGLELPIPVVLLVLVLAFYFVLMRYTRYGKHIYAIGANQEASRLAGIRLEREVALAFILMGAMVALAALITVSQVGAASPTTGQGLEFLALTGVILGGASLHGGSGTVFGTTIAIVILAILDNGLVLLGVTSFWQEVARGVLLLVAVVFDELGREGGLREIRMEL